MYLVCCGSRERWLVLTRLIVAKGILLGYIYITVTVVKQRLRFRFFSYSVALVLPYDRLYKKEEAIPSSDFNKNSRKSV